MRHSIAAADSDQKLFGLMEDLLCAITQEVHCPVSIWAQEKNHALPRRWTQSPRQTGDHSELIVRVDGSISRDRPLGEFTLEHEIVPSLILHGKRAEHLDGKLAQRLAEAGQLVQKILNHESMVFESQNETIESNPVADSGVVRLLLNLQHVLREENDFHSTMHRLTQMFTQFFKSDAGGLLLQGEDNRLEFVGLFGGGKNLQGVKLPVGQGVVGWAAQNMVPVICNEPTHDSRFDSEFAQAAEYPVNSVMAAPLMLGAKCIGVIETLNPEPRGDEEARFTSYDLDLLTVIAAQLSYDIEERRIEEERIAGYRMASVGRTATFFAHDLKGPLQTVHGCGDLLLMGVNEKEELLHMGQLLTSVADEIIEMTQALVTFSRKSGPLFLEELEVAQIVEPLQTRWPKPPKNKKVVILFDINAPRGLTEPARVRRIIRNLVNNALDATRPGTTVTSEISVVQDRLLICVSDKGNGLPSDTFDTLTSQLTEKTGDRPKLGLGLAIVEQFTRELNGKIRVTRSSSEGTRVLVDLPFRPI